MVKLVALLAPPKLADHPHALDAMLLDQTAMRLDELLISRQSTIAAASARALGATRGAALVVARRAMAGLTATGAVLASLHCAALPFPKKRRCWIGHDNHFRIPAQASHCLRNSTKYLHTLQKLRFAFGHVLNQFSKNKSRSSDNANFKHGRAARFEQTRC